MMAIWWILLGVSFVIMAWALYFIIDDTINYSSATTSRCEE